MKIKRLIEGIGEVEIELTRDELEYYRRCEIVRDDIGGGRLEAFAGLSGDALEVAIDEIAREMGRQQEENKLDETAALNAAKGEYIFKHKLGDALEGDFVIEDGVLVKYTGDSGYVIIPEGVTKIGDDVFCYCDSLVAISVPDSVLHIGSHAFYGCDGLERVTFGACSQLETIGKFAFADCEKLERIDIPSSVTIIGEYAFDGCTHLSSVMFSEDSGLQSIGDCAFISCSNLERFDIPSGVSHIGVNPFVLCPNLLSVPVHPNNRFYRADDDVLFTQDGTKIILCAGGKQGEYRVPDGVKLLAECAFSDCKSLTGVEISSSVLALGDEAFYGCSNLRYVRFSDDSNVRFIHPNAFSGCDRLESIDLPSYLMAICGDLDSLDERIVEASEQCGKHESTETGRDAVELDL